MNRRQRRVEYFSDSVSELTDISLFRHDSNERRSRKVGYEPGDRRVEDDWNELAVPHLREDVEPDVSFGRLVTGLVDLAECLHGRIVPHVKHEEVVVTLGQQI